MTLELARAFHRFGHRVIAADSVRHYLCRVSNAVETSYQLPAPNQDREAFLDELETILVNERVDVLIPTCEEIFHIAQGWERLRRHCLVWASPLDQLEALHNKWTFYLLAKGLGLPVPETKRIHSPEERLDLASDERLKESLVLKPVYSRFASRVLFLEPEDPPEQRKRLLMDHIPAEEPVQWIAQRRIFGREICTYSIAYDGKLLAHAAYPSRYRVGQGAAVYFQSMEHEAVRAWVCKFVKAIRFTGQIAFDFIEEPDGTLYALECNPRATSGIHLFGADSKFVQALLQPGERRKSGMVLPPKEARPAMAAAAMAAASWRSIFRFSDFRRWCRDFVMARDVVFRWNDLRPSAEALRMLYDAWRTSRAHGVTISQATTIDIEWNGGA